VTHRVKEYGLPGHPLLLLQVYLVVVAGGAAPALVRLVVAGLHRLQELHRHATPGPEYCKI